MGGNEAGGRGSQRGEKNGARQRDGEGPRDREGRDFGRKGGGSRGEEEGERQVGWRGAIQVLTRAVPPAGKCQWGVRL